MKRILATTVILILITGFFNSPLQACTTFVISNDSNIVLGRNYDFPVGKGQIHINKRNQSKKALIMPPEKPLQWVSKYGSVTFTQAGKEFPYGGMNEAGLVIELMWLNETQYPEPDHRFGLSELQWIQYQLDVSACVEDVIASDTLVRISKQAFSKLHFIITDATGKTATLEYLNGKTIIHSGKNLPYAALANCPYNRSLQYINTSGDKKKSTFSNWTRNSSGRFALAANMVKKYNGEQPVNQYAFKVLNAVSQGSSTQWSIVYNITEKKIYYKTSEFNKVQCVSLNSFDYSCSANNLFIGISDRNNSEKDFRNYSFEENLKLIHYITNNVDFLKGNVPPEHIRATANYPESVVCVQ